MRRIISFAFASGLLIAGLYLLYLEVFVARIIMGRMLAMGALLATGGGAWLWADFVLPLCGGKETG